MIVAASRLNRLIASADEMKFLLRAEPEPRARKIKSRARNFFQPQHAAIKRAAFFYVGNVDGDVIDLENFQSCFRWLTRKPNFSGAFANDNTPFFSVTPR